MFFVSPEVWIIASWRRRRFLFDVFLVRMWLLNARMRFTFPDPVILKRFLAPLCDFIFGISIPLCLSVSSDTRVIFNSRFQRPASRFYLGARIIVMNFPSNFGSLSIFATSASSSATRFTT